MGEHLASDGDPPPGPNGALGPSRSSGLDPAGAARPRQRPHRPTARAPSRSGNGVGVPPKAPRRGDARSRTARSRCASVRRSAPKPTSERGSPRPYRARARRARHCCPGAAARPAPSWRAAEATASIPSPAASSAPSNSRCGACGPGDRPVQTDRKDGRPTRCGAGRGPGHTSAARTRPHRAVGGSSGAVPCSHRSGRGAFCQPLVYAPRAALAGHRHGIGIAARPGPAPARPRDRQRPGRPRAPRARSWPAHPMRTRNPASGPRW